MSNRVMNAGELAHLFSTLPSKTVVFIGWPEEEVDPVMPLREDDILKRYFFRYNDMDGEGFVAETPEHFEDDTMYVGELCLCLVP